MSSFLASIFLGKIAPIDIADACGMNRFDIKRGYYNQKLMALAAGSSDLESKLGQVPEDGGGSFGDISQYFVQRYGFHSSCMIAPFTGDNPCTYFRFHTSSFEPHIDPWDMSWKTLLQRLFQGSLGPSGKQD